MNNLISRDEIESDILENAQILSDAGKISTNTIEEIKRFCEKSRIGDHNCNVKTRFGWCCDLCIENELLHLHNLGVHTIGSCCGHGNGELSSILVVGDESIKKMLEMGYNLSKNQVDDSKCENRLSSFTPKTVFAYQYNLDSGRKRTVKAMDELERLRAENAKLRELVGLAESDVKVICKFCVYQLESERCTTCTGDHWQWQHADKLKEIDGKDGV